MQRNNNRKDMDMKEKNMDMKGMDVDKDVVVLGVDKKRKKRTILVVFLVRERKSWYFSSISAIFRVFKPAEVGFTSSYLHHANLGAVASKKAIIKRVEVITYPE